MLTLLPGCRLLRWGLLTEKPGCRSHDHLLAVVCLLSNDLYAENFIRWLLCWLLPAILEQKCFLHYTARQPVLLRQKRL